MSVALLVSGAVLVGLVWGRFLNGLMDRLPRGESLFSLPFSCPRCQRALPLRHLIPIVGVWHHQRECGTFSSTPWRAPVVEVLTPLAFALVAWRMGAIPQTLVILAYLSILAIVLVCDLEHTLIPNRLVYSALPLALALAPLGPPGSHSPETGAYLNALAGAASALGVFLFLYGVARGRLGAGDVKLATLVGAMLGFPLGLIALGLAAGGGGIGALVLLALRRKALRDVLPYGPFLAGGAILSLFWGEAVLDAYMTLLGVPH